MAADTAYGPHRDPVRWRTVRTSRGPLPEASRRQPGRAEPGTFDVWPGKHRHQSPAQAHRSVIYNGGRVTDVYRRNAASPWCLSGSDPAGCEPADLSGTKAAQAGEQ